jgi:predicted transposase YbfD/YdcC
MQPKEKEIISLYERIRNELGDSRGKQGQKHDLAFTLLGYLSALITLCPTRASAHRYMTNHFEWLKTLTGHKAEACVSYTQLGRILRSTNHEQMSAISAAHFGIKIEKISDSEWIAGDGKDLKGSFDSSVNASRGEVIVRLVTHETKQVVAQGFYHGNKESEIPTIRNLLINNKLEGINITLDALHCNPSTTALIAQKRGHYIVRAKEEHQKELVKDLTSKARRLKPLAEFTDHDKGHGRVEKRVYTCFDISTECFEKRWAESDLSTCIVVERTTYDIKTKKTHFETAFYISNVALLRTNQSVLKRQQQSQLFVQSPEKKLFDARKVCDAIRAHWSIEADNYIRDVSLGEDKCKTPKSNTTKTLAILRTMALEWLKAWSPKNFKELADLCRDCPNLFEQKLKLSNFIT